MTRDDYTYTADDQGHSMEWIMAQNLSTLHWLGIFQDSKMIWIQQVISYVQAKGRLVISVGWVDFCFIGSDHKTCLVVPEKARNFGLWRPQSPLGQKTNNAKKTCMAQIA